MNYDAIVVGARVAGSATAMLLARQGLRVLAVDRARFPSDTLSTHQVQLPGVARLRDWGLLDPLVAAGTPATTTLRFDTGRAVLHGPYPTWAGVNAIYSPRRTLLDQTLVDAARAAGAEVIEGFAVEELLYRDGRVAGIAGRAKGGPARQFRSSLVIGADGKHSLVARTVAAPRYRVRPAASAGCYGYFADLPTRGGEVYVRPDRMIGVWPTTEGLSIVYLVVPGSAFAALRADLDRNFRAAGHGLGDLGERLRGARQVEHYRATVDLPNVIRQPYGPGWALVGDAGLVMDPITGQGIGHALGDAAELSDAVVAGLGGGRGLTAALKGYHRRRDAARRPMYDLTVQLAAFRPDPAGDRLFPAIAQDPDQVGRFLGVLTGAVPVNDFFAPGNLRRIVGTRGLFGLLLSRLARRPRHVGREDPRADVIADTRNYV